MDENCSMSKKNNKKCRNERQFTPLVRHERHGTRLVPPLASLNMRDINWARDYGPECLWVGSMADTFGIDEFVGRYYAFMDAFDEFWNHSQDVALGLISDFGMLSNDSQDKFFKKNTNLIEQIFGETVAPLLGFYPDSPASWLVKRLKERTETHLNPAKEFPRLRRILSGLNDGQGAIATRVKAAMFGRMIKHEKVKFFQGLEIVELLPKYPSECTPDERGLVEGHIRANMSALLSMREVGTDRAWPKYFWRHNFNLTVCQPRVVRLRGANELEQNEANAVFERLAMNADAVLEYVAQLQQRAKIDLYDPARDEILAGLFSRAARLFFLIATTPQLWARDVGGIILRCLADTAITFCYLAQKGTSDEFEAFRKHGEGQEKLLMLHLQDSHPRSKTIEGRNAESLSSDFGRLAPELISIELGHWIKKDARKLAIEAGMEELYRLVYTPASSDVHGTWASLKHSNLVVCFEEMHRYHRLPGYSEPPVYLGLVETAQRLFLHAQVTASQTLGYPVLRRLEQVAPALLSV
jgi:Family of unknown function (DUF5677)